MWLTPLSVLLGPLLVYDAPSPPAGLFDDFLTNLSDDTELTGDLRIAVNTVSILGYPDDFLQPVLNETTYWESTLPVGFGYVTYDIEPLLPNVYDHATSPSAWPGSRAFFSPFHIQYAWTGDGSTDDVMINGLKESAANLRANAGVTVPRSVYVNYALAVDTPLEAMYGDNLERLRSIAKEVDPENVMGLTGGFRF